jgi:hypothetical protein
MVVGGMVGGDSADGHLRQGCWVWRTRSEGASDPVATRRLVRSSDVRRLELELVEVKRGVGIGGSGQLALSRLESVEVPGLH